MKKFVFILGGPEGPLHKIQGYRGIKMSANADLVAMQTYVQQEKNN